MIRFSKWITIADVDVFGENERSLLFRKTFVVNGQIVSAELQICMLGLGVCAINGKPVTDEVYTTPFTRYDKRVIFRRYDVTNLLKTGKNAIGAHVGNGFYNNNMITWNDKYSSWRGVPKMTAALCIKYADGKEENICTDTSWKSVLGPCLYNNMRQGEMYDARLNKIGFDTAEYDDSDWEYAFLTNEPGGILEETDMPPIRVIEVLEPKKIGKDLYDFGKNISGRVRFTVNGKKGQKIKLIYDEVLNPYKLNKRNVAQYAIKEKMPLLHENVYICGGAKDETYAPEFCYHGFRYVTVKNAPKEFSFEAERIHTDLTTVGSFTSSDSMLNRIHNASVLSTTTNYFGFPTDCPHREQNGWTGDALVSIDQSLMNFDMKEAYRKWLLDFKDAQRANGQLPGIIPTAGWGYNWGSGPAWDSVIVQFPWKVYENTGDSSLISLMWENMKLYMSYMERRSDGFIADFGLGDWCPPRNANYVDIPTAVTDTGYFYANCRLMAKMAPIMKEKAEPWEDKARQIKGAWRKAFLDDEDLKSSQTFLACAIYQGFLEEDEIAPAAKALAELVEKSDYHIVCGILGTKYIFSALSENGYADALYRAVTNPSYPSYAYWLECGYTTLCELWKKETSSANHHMFSEVDNWFYRYIGGIKLTADSIVIEPCFIEALDFVKVTHRDISVEWNKEELKVTVPKTATVIINGKGHTVEAGEHSFSRT